MITAQSLPECNGGVSPYYLPQNPRPYAYNLYCLPSKAFRQYIYIEIKKNEFCGSVLHLVDVEIVQATEVCRIVDFVRHAASLV